MPNFHLANILKTLLTLFMACAVGTSFAGENITAHHYWQDETGLASFEEAQGKNYKSFEGVLSLGYTQSVTWIRLDISPPEGEDKLVLRIRPVFLDEITLFDPLDKSGKVRMVGDKTRYEDNEYQSLTHTLVIPSGDAPRSVWIRLKTTSTTLINIEAFTPEEMQRGEFNLLMRFFAILALVAMFMLLVLINWFNYQENLYAFFVVRQVYYFLYTASAFGFHRYLLSDVMDANQLNLFFSWVVIGSTLISFGFEYSFLREYSLTRPAKVLFSGLFIWSLFVLVLMLIGHESEALKLNLWMNTVGAFSLLVIAAFFIDGQKIQGNPAASLLDKKVVVGYYLLMNFVLAFCLMPFLGFMKGNEFAVNALVIYTLFSSFLMTVLMHFRANKIQKVQRTFEQELLISKKQVELEMIRREEQTHLFHMLMHELKNPLAIIDMALLAKNDLEKTSSYVTRAVNNMKAILERCVKADKLTEGTISINKKTIEINHFLRDMLITDGQPEDRIVFHGVGTLAIKTDEQLLGIMLGNLVDNAIRYGDQLVPVQIKTKTQRNSAGVEGVSIVVTNPPGTASWPDTEKVFKKYYRSTGAEAQSGTGLGLYLVRALANLLGGECRYAPDDTNINFELWLPS